MRAAHKRLRLIGLTLVGIIAMMIGLPVHAQADEGQLVDAIVRDSIKITKRSSGSSN